MKASRTLVATESSLIPVQPPLTKIKRFWCKDAPFVGYEIIESKEIVLSPRQLTIKSVKKPDQVAVEFIKANNLSSREVTLPNRSKITAYPLCTVVAYWSYLNSFGLLPEHEKKVLAALISGEEIKEEKAYLRENGSRVAPTPVEIIDHPVPLAKVVKVEILEGTELSIFVIDDRSKHQFWIEETEGLSIIKASPTALIEQTGEARREEYLKKKKYGQKDLLPRERWQGVQSSHPALMRLDTNLAIFRQPEEHPCFVPASRTSYVQYRS